MDLKDLQALLGLSLQDWRIEFPVNMCYISRKNIFPGSLYSVSTVKTHPLKNSLIVSTKQQ